MKQRRELRILIYGINYAPELTGVGKYTGEMAGWLSDQGHEVRAISAPPYYPAWHVEVPYSSFKYHSETLDGVTVIRCPLWVPRRPSGVKRILHLLSFALSSLPVVLLQLFRRPDVVVVIEPTLLCVPASLALAKLAGSRSWLHVQDFEVDAASALRQLGSGSLSGFASAIEGWLMRRFDRVSSISAAMMERLDSKGVPVERQVLFPNWVDCEKLTPLPQAKSLREEWGIPQQAKVVLYAGNIGRKQGIEILLDVAEYFGETRPEVFFLVVGDGAAREGLVRLARTRQLRNVLFKPLQSLEKLGPMLATADIHLVLQRRGAADLVMPSKLTGILAAGGVALVTADPGTELYRIVTGSQLGLAVEPESVQSITEGILHLISDAELCAGLRENARKYAEQVLEKSVVLRGFEKALLCLR